VACPTSERERDWVGRLYMHVNAHRHEFHNYDCYYFRCFYYTNYKSNIMFHSICLSVYVPSALLTTTTTAECYAPPLLPPPPALPPSLYDLAAFADALATRPFTALTLAYLATC
jgi:hypothetical protein